ncbi:MAG: tetratricopeptide repeat protein [Candidatus Omnitrophota bacterium]
MNEKETDMFEELFIDSEKSGGDFFIPYTPKAACLKMLQSSKKQETRNYGLLMLAQWYRVETAHNAGKYDACACDELISMMLDFSRKYPAPGFVIAATLLGEGAKSEKSRDYESALKFYKASLRCSAKDPSLKYFQLNNLGFCLNFFRKFDNAEEFLRAAVAMAPERYNAWKNLGVTLEHQGKYEEAAECYMKAIEHSQGERRSVRHLKRLIIRQPALTEKYPEIHNEE